MRDWGVMNLCIVSNGSVYHKGAGTYQSRDTFPVYVNALSKYFSKVFCVLPVYPQENEEIPFVWRPSSNVAVVEAYPVSSVIEYYRYLPLVLAQNIRALSRCIRNSDIVLLRVHSMNNYISYMFARKYRKKLACYVIGSQRTIVREGSRYKGMKKILARGIAGLHESMDRRIINQSDINIFLGSYLASIYGQSIGDQGRNHLSFTSLVAPEDIIERTGSDLRRDEVKLLYAGRLSSEKGLSYLIEAVEKLMRRGTRLELNIVGEDKGTGERDKLQLLVERLQVQSLVRFRGQIPYGEELDQIFLGSDIFVLPSISEGVPKVLLEAMAKGLPVIAAKVGGVPEIIRDYENGLLIPPKSADAIVMAITVLQEEKELRSRLVANGYVFVREHTIENQARDLANLIQAKL